MVRRIWFPTLVLLVLAFLVMRGSLTLSNDLDAGSYGPTDKRKLVQQWDIGERFRLRREDINVTFFVNGDQVCEMTFPISDCDSA